MINDNKFINKNTLTTYCNTNEKLLKGKVTGVIVEFPGLGGSSCLGGSVNMGDYDSAFAKRCGENGIILAYMFPGPWSWGNHTACRISDTVIDAIADKYNLPENFPLVVSGGSMGGQGCIIFAADSKHKVTAVASACPCCDVPDRFDSNPGFPRTFITAVAEYDMPFEEGLKQISPIHRINDLKKIPYFICSDGEDECFPEYQCDEFVDKMVALGHNVTYKKQPGKRHGEFFPDVRQALSDFMMKYALNGKKEVETEAAPLYVDEVRKADDYSLRLYFSHNVKINGTPKVSIRYTVDGTGVRKELVDGAMKTLEFCGTLKQEDASTALWTMSEENDFGLKEVSKVLERAGALYAFDCPIKLCIICDNGASITAENALPLPNEVYYDIH